MKIQLHEIPVREVANGYKANCQTICEQIVN